MIASLLQRRVRAISITRDTLQMKKILVAFAVSLAFVTPLSFAQNAAAAPQAAADPAALAATGELFEAMNYRAVAQGTLEQMRRTMPAMMTQGATAAIDNNPKLNAAEKKNAHEKLNKELPQAVKLFDGVFGDPSLVDEMLRATAQIYARHFTVDELHQIAAFYKTPVGTKMLATMPQLMAESMQAGQQVVMPRVAAIMHKLEQPK
ncbi:DUF2059 domain-containing protein [Massilia pinisoli]|uniref:DUF2059 domain-containing protein n=1 Tax=Massilia pinisoli TaxID=1772194 RepID=A0ABT1ZLV8_9BURK|nr:DUF2059 domain-containing protein [Massilia pinisoli]MCS0580891.1 DUF2059 domain-containing protein [Massilia pinisoli]